MRKKLLFISIFTIVHAGLTVIVLASQVVDGSELGNLESHPHPLTLTGVVTLILTAPSGPILQALGGGGEIDIGNELFVFLGLLANSAVSGLIVFCLIQLGLNIRQRIRGASGGH